MPEPRSAFADLERRIREQSVYLDPVNRHRAAYLRGDISVEEMEARIADELGLADRSPRDGSGDSVDVPAKPRIWWA